MKISSLAVAAQIGFLIVLAQGLAAEAAEIKLIGATPMTAVIKELGSQFERDTGHKLVTKFVSGPVVKREIDAGETFDIAVSITPVIDDLIKEGKIVAGIEWRSAEAKTERLPGLATELVRLKVEVIVTRRPRGGPCCQERDGLNPDCVHVRG